MTGPRLAVIGGGIAGLAAAWELRGRAEVSVFEPGHLGGKIRTTPFAGRPVDEGPDAFLTRVPAAIGLCEELGISDQLVAPSAGRTLVWTTSGLRRLPEGLVLGVPTSIRPLASSGLLTTRGMARAGLDLLLPRSDLGADVSVDELVGRRFGTEVAQRLVEPLLGSIHAAPTAELSTAATAPNLLAAARESRSLLRGLRRQAAAGRQAAERRQAGAGRQAAGDRQAAAARRGQGAGAQNVGPLFLTPRDGLERMVQRMVELLLAAGTVFTPARITEVVPDDGAILVDGERFDGAVLAVPARDAAGLLGDRAPAGLRAIETTDVVLVTMELAADDVAVGPDVNGILAQPGVDSVMTACSFGSSKWPQWRTEADRVVVRVSAGRHGDRRAMELSDEDLVARLAADLGRALGRAVAPSSYRVSRWPASFPLYRVGHLGLVAVVESELSAAAPGVALAGASYRGAGIPACITSGREAARRVLVSAGATVGPPTAGE